MIKVGVFTSNEHKAEEMFDKIINRNKGNVKFYKFCKDYKQLMLNDETYYVWIRPTDSSRGHRCQKAYIDKDIDIKLLREIVMPICVYCKKEDIVMF